MRNLTLALAMEHRNVRLRSAQHFLTLAAEQGCKEKATTLVRVSMIHWRMARMIGEEMQRMRETAKC